jgi:tetratricopeptide (TPR) repeat protein
MRSSSGVNDETRAIDMCTSGKRRRALACVAALLLLPIGRARAESSPEDKALARTLFQDGRALMAAQKLDEACPKLEESQRLDPSGGTLLNLALCHEQQGRFASSWSEFNEAVAVARRDGRRDREQEGQTHARALEPRLSRLTVVVPAGTQVEGLRIERDGREIGRGAWSTAMPIDGGEHVVRATATGRDPFATTVVMEKEGDAKTIEIPVLATPVVVVAPPRVEAPVLVAPPPPPPAPMSPIAAKRLRWGGSAAAGVGVALLVGAGYELSQALDAKDASKADCDASDQCGPVGRAQRADAVSHGNWATVLGVGGAVAIGGAAALYYFGWRGAKAHAAAHGDVNVTIGAGPGAMMTGVGGTF